MNVLFLTTHLNTGGITSYLLTLSKGMIERGVRVHIASSGGDMAAEFSALGVRLLDLNIRTKSELDPRIYYALLFLNQYVRQHAIDMIHAQTRVTQVMGFWLATMTGRSYVSTCHGFFKTHVSRLMFPCWGGAVVAISEAVQKHLHDDFQIADERISLIPSGIDIRMYPPVDAMIKYRMRRKYGLGEEPVMGIIARLSEVKGQDILIMAMKTVAEQIPDAKLIIAGEGKTEPLLRKMVKEFQLEKNVLFYPLTNRSVEILPLLDIFVMPSRQEGLGISIMEAQAAGVPVIASRVGGIPSLIEEGRTGFLVEPEDPIALGQTILMALRDPDRLARVASAGRESIRTNHSADLMVEKVLTLYKTTIPKARS